MGKFARHKARWKDCRECELCDVRRKVVLARGKLPCDVLFVGEAPGASEDVLGRPFVGPAGTLLDHMINESDLSNARTAFTNLIACIPKDENMLKVHEPDKEHIKACRSRLIEMVEIAQPQILVAVGNLSKKWLPKVNDELESPIEVVSVIHPAAILRMDISQQGLAVQRTILTLDTVNEKLVPF